MKKTSLLWLLAIAGILILAVLTIRPPAWATPLQGATHLPTSVDVQPGDIATRMLADSPATTASASRVELQADTPSSDNCIACHTDKKKLKAIAEEPEEVKSEAASGEG
ncbi:MAG TPA: hypothetical protein EYP25_03785 [Anaerolineae bacterium]|nr:hypothetical protein [Caldilineae bacterium]HID33684.1 hypothetical protein [Anaerolineae bacterium]